MQFSVPQFTDVEDRIVAGLTFKQFGIVFGAAAIVFAVFTLTKNIIITVAFGMLLGLPALFLAFGKINGRPIYTTFGPLLGYLTGGRMYVFHKEARTASAVKVQKSVAQVAPEERLSAQATMVRLKNLNYVLQQQSSQQHDLIERIKTSKQLSNKR